MNSTLNSTNFTDTAEAACLYGVDTNPEALSSMESISIITILLNVPLALTAIIGNGLIFMVYYQNESLRNPANTILVSLAITDFLTGAASQPIFIYEKFLILAHSAEKLCNMQITKVFVVNFLLAATLLNLSVTTLDRYLAVVHSLRYPEIVTKERVAKALTIMWLAWIATAIASFFVSIYLIISVIVVTTSIIFIVALNCKIFREIHRLQTNTVATANEAEEARKAAERRTAKTVGIIIGLLVFCYVPMLVCLLIFFVAGLSSEMLYKQSLYIAVTVAFSNSSLNVFVYFWKNTEIRFAMMKIFRNLRQCCRNRFSSDANP